MNKPTVKQVPAHTNNYSTSSYKKTGIVLHWMVGTLSGTDKVFQDPNRQASTQYGIGATGEIHQYVDDKYTAYHAGVSQYNRASIGIEHEGGYLVNGQRVKPSPECHQASAKLVAWLCKTHGIPCNRQSIIKHSETGYATQCCGSLDIDWIISEANNILNGNTMFDYELYVKENNLFMRIKSGSINENVTVKNVTKGTSWQVFANKSVGNDGGAINTGMEGCLYEVVAKGVVRQYDNRPKPTDPCADVKAQLNAANEEIKRLNAAIGGLTADRNKYRSLSEELQSKLTAEEQENIRLKTELEAAQKCCDEGKHQILILEQELANQQPKIEELEQEVYGLNTQLETIRAEYQKLAEAYEKVVQNCKGNPQDYMEIIRSLLRIIESLVARTSRKVKGFIARMRDGKK